MPIDVEKFAKHLRKHAVGGFGAVSSQAISLGTMGKTGFSISSSEIFGLDQAIEHKSRAMSFTALVRCIVVVSLALANCVAQAKGSAPPRILQEPIFGLRLEVARMKLDLLPDEVRNQCLEIADNESLTGRQWVYAIARDTRGTYYVVGGYFERRHPEQGESRYRLDTYGGVYRIDGTGCLGIGAAYDVFNNRSFNETPQPILQQLAVDFAVRLARAFGGRDRLQMKFRNKHVDPDSLSPELREAFNPYFRPSPSSSPRAE